MDNLSQYAHRPLSLLFRHIKTRAISHAAIVICVLAAVGCSVSTQYGVKYLVDILSTTRPQGSNPWPAFVLLSSFIAADNLLWRVAGWIAAHTFVRVTGDLRHELFQYLMHHSPRYFSDRSPGALTSRITATSNACFLIENMFVWNVLPPCVATLAAIGFVAWVNPIMAACLFVAAAIMVVAMFTIAARGKPLHHDFADKAAAVDGEMNDVVGNILLVKAFGAFGYEQRRFANVIERETTARRRSLLYLEKLRLLHAFITIVLVLSLLAWAIVLWRNGTATTGEVILICTLGISVLHATRDLAVALVDVTQHMARLSEAVATLLVVHEFRDRPNARPLARAGASVTFKDVSFAYRAGHEVISNFSTHIEAGQRVGLVGPSGGGKSTLLALLQRHYSPQGGRILLDGQDIASLTRDSVQQAIAVVPQDISLFHRSLMENIRYGCPDASDQAVREAAIAAHCDEFIHALPNGFDTIVGDRGLKLSGGQRQRIALARAFLKNAPILLLDEATSALDHESEAAIEEASARLMQGRTVIAIAHRLSTLRNFDRLIAISAGRLIHEGPPNELVEADGRLRESLRREIVFNGANDQPRRAQVSETSRSRSLNAVG
jgi:ATP-binding cassette, subfamily B, bacterial